MKELMWENGYITSFEEGIQTQGALPMSTTFEVSAQILKIGGAEFEQNWPQ